MIGMLKRLKYFPGRRKKPTHCNLAKKGIEIMNVFIPMSSHGLFKLKIYLSKTLQSNRNLIIVTFPPPVLILDYKPECSF